MPYVSGAGAGAGLDDRAPAPGAAGAASTVTVSRARWREFPGHSDRGANPAFAELVGDLVRPYGVPLRPDDGGGHSYGEMLAPLISDLVPAAEPADVLILGFAVPDVYPERATATFLSSVCPGRPLAFAVCDQGCAAGFTALRLARDYTTAGGCRRVLVALAEQARLDYDPPAPARLPARQAGFAMLCDAGMLDADTVPAPAAFATGPGHGGGPSLLAVRVLPAVAAEQVPAVLRSELADLAANGPGGAGRPGPPGTPGTPGRLVLGEGLAPLAGETAGWQLEPLPPGQPLTGVWREVAAWAAAPGRGTLVIADYDPGLRYLGLAAFTGGA